MTSPFAEWAWSYIQRGFSVVPILSGAKAPGFDGHLITKWQNFCKEQPDIEQIREWSRDPLAGIGVCCGYEGVVAIDVDDVRAFPIVSAVLGGRGAPTKRGKKGCTAFFRDPTGLITSKQFSRPEGGHFVEILCGGRQSVLPPSIHPETGEPYGWVKDSMEAMRPSQLPIFTEDDKSRLGELLAPLRGRSEAEEPQQPAVDAKEIKEELAKRSHFEQCRYRGMAAPFLDSVANNLGTMGVGGRNSGLYAAARSIGWATAAGYLNPAVVEAKLLAACDKNGLAKEKTRKDMKRSISNGLSDPDGLPNLDSIPDKPEYVAKQQLWQKRQQERREWEERNTRFARIPRNPAFAASEAAQSPL